MAKRDSMKLYKETLSLLDQELISALAARTAELSTLASTLDVLKDVSTGLYDEIDKLCKKAPAETITDLALNQVNTVIKETKEIPIVDAFVARLTEFIPAGNNPEHRDVVVVLKQLQLGQVRLTQSISGANSTNRRLLAEAKGLVCAIELLVEGTSQADIGKNALKYYGHHMSDYWYDEEECFNFNRIAEMDPKTYFLPK